MNSESIVAPVEADVARLYEQASPEIRQKVQAFVTVLMRETATADPRLLSELMDIISERAQARGLTPEILDDILRD